MTYLLFATALALSACAAFYSIMGLVAIFAASVVPIFIMGSLLEASKLVVASWLYRNWKEVPVLLKTYFTIALVILMLLTSMGIFGYLSKAHLDQTIPSGDVAAKLSLIDEKIKTEKENINANRKELSQLDSQVDSTLSRTTDANGTERAISIRRGQQKDRQRILKEIGDTQAKIAKYNEERAPIASEVRKVEAEVGPIKYIAALIYGDNPSEDILEKSVRWVIILIVSVFDPLAVLLLVAANWNQKREDENTGLEIFAGNSEVVTTPPAEEPFPPVSNPVNWTTTTEYYEPETETTEVKLEDNFCTTDDAHLSVKGDEHIVEKTVVNYVPTTEDELDIKIDDTTEWEPKLYDRVADRNADIPSRTKAFLQKAKQVFSSSENT